MELAAKQRAQLEQNGFALPKTSGNSMRPLIWADQHRVVVTPVNSPVQTGDILMFVHYTNGHRHTVLHRVVSISSTNAGTPVYTTRGDNCLTTETVTPDCIIGRVAEVHRISGYRPWHALPLGKFAVTHPACRAYTRIWLASWPVRRLIYLARYHFQTIFARLKTYAK